MYHDRAGFDFEKVFPRLPDGIAVAADGVGGMRIKSLHGNDVPYRRFLDALPAHGFSPLKKGTVIWRYHGARDIQKKIVSGEAFYKYLDHGFGAVAEYTGEHIVLCIIRGLGE